MKKNVIGIRTEYLLPGLIAGAVALASAFLPYVSQNGTGLNLLKLALGGSVLHLAALTLGVLGLLLGAVNFARPSVRGTRLWVAAAALGLVSYAVLLLANKSILDSMGVLAEPFLVKDLRIGYWMGFLASLATLVLSMKTAKINVGYIVLVVLSIIWLFPILWIVLTSLRAEKGYYVGYFIPKGFTIQNYLAIFSNPDVLPFGIWWRNTMFVAVISSVVNTLIVLATAFVLSRTRFKGRTSFMKILMIIGMFPGFMSMLAVYNILKGLGLNQSLFSLIIVGAAGAAMGYHVCKGFFDTIPKALDEAAIIDGCTRWQIFTKITIPLSKPIAINTLLTNFLGAWSDYIFPSMLFGDQQSNYTAAVGLYWMTDFRRIDGYYTQFAAGAVIVAVPIVVLFIWLQKYYVEGLAGSVKG